jgi:hypothetical protein
MTDAATIAAAQALAAPIAAGDAAPFHGIRVKSLEAPTRRRGVRTLQLFVRTLIEAGGPTDSFLITLPKVTSAEQVDAFVFALGRVEEAAMAGFLLRGLECGALDPAELDTLVGVEPDTLASLARQRPKA